MITGSCSFLQEHRDLLADALDTLEFQDGQPIFRQGEIGSQFYIVKSGKVLVIKGPDTKPLAELKEGQFFGERSLIRDDPRCNFDPLLLPSCAKPCNTVTPHPQ